jgi:hypothetical protein
MPRLFALDQNFPDPIVKVLSEFQVEATLVPVREIDVRLVETDMDDWELLLALHLHSDPWDGLITTDTSMLNLPRELSVLMQTRLTLVAIREAGHDMVKASGLLFAYLPGICKRTDSTRPQLWTPAAADRAATDPWDQFAKVADHRSVDPQELYADSQLSPEQLARSPLD